MTSLLAVDASALLLRYVPDKRRDLVVEAMASASAWATSALTRTELHMAIHRLAVAPSQYEQLWRSAASDWESFWVVPVDQRCLSDAGTLGATYGLRTGDAIHLAAAARLPKPSAFLTMDRRQIPAAAELGLEVIAPLDT